MEGVAENKKARGMTKIIITGGAGFLGSHLADYLLDRGDEVLVIDDLSTGSHENIDHLPDSYGRKFRFLCCSAGDYGAVRKSFEWCDQVYHLASAVGVRRIIDEPVDAVRNIVNTTDNVLSLCARYRKPVLITSTSEVYGKGCAIPFKESDDVMLGPTSSPRWSYAAAKMVDEFLALAYHREYGLPVRVVRLFNTVGLRQTGRYGMVLPTFVAQAKAGGPITVYGDGKQTRCFASVHDIAPGLIAVMESEEAAGQVVNLGSDEEISIADLATLVQDVVGRECRVSYQTYSQAYGVAFDDMQRRVPDLARARKLINWWPAIKTREIVEELARCA